MNLKRKILSKYPKAFIEFDIDGNVFVIIPELGNDYKPAVEYFYPLTSDIETAWAYAVESLKVTQNFNRSHPNRMSLENFESKMLRMQLKQEKIRNSKKLQKNEIQFISKKT